MIVGLRNDVVEVHFGVGDSVALCLGYPARIYKHLCQHSKETRTAIHTLIFDTLCQTTARSAFSHHAKVACRVRLCSPEHKQERKRRVPPVAPLSTARRSELQVEPARGPTNTTESLEVGLASLTKERIEPCLKTQDTVLGISCLAYL